MTHSHCNHLHVAAYLWELGRMRKVVLQAPDESTLKELAETLQQNVDHVLWLEQPENAAPQRGSKPLFDEVPIFQMVIASCFDIFEY